jgi:gamma-glutamyltranspeptidase / glutathione hydrolase
MNMTEPCSTGIGGDMFCLFYDATTNKVSALNGSGRAGGNATLEKVRNALGEHADEIPRKSPHAVTVPGAAAGWVDTVERFGSGRLSMEQILAPAVTMGEKGFPVSELASHMWHNSEGLLKEASENGHEMLKHDPTANGGYRAPRAGEIMKNPTLAKTFRALATEGKKGFYTGRIAEEIINVLKAKGGFMELEDLEDHLERGSEPVAPISLKFRGQGLQRGKKRQADGEVKKGADQSDDGVELWEHPPNGQGIVALMALGIMQELEKQGKIPTFGPEDHNSAKYLHAVIESLRIAFADGNWWIADPNTSKVPSAGLLDQDYLAGRAKLFDPDKASDGSIAHGSPALRSSDTVYFAVSDSQGNAISFINSNYQGFGTGIIPKGCGFTLQNRGSNFNLAPDDHPNIYAPGKRPYHTIIPGLVTNTADNSLHSVFGVMGGFMQPQGHLQVLLGQIVANLSVQQALDAPRICITPKADSSGMVVKVERGIPDAVITELESLGHTTERITGLGRSEFGRGQIIRWTVDPQDKIGVWSAGSDPRGDGAAYPQ